MKASSASCPSTRPSTMSEATAQDSRTPSLTIFPISLYDCRNLWLREEVRGVATGQYNFPPPAQLQYIDQHYIVLDHTPLVGASGGAAYKWKTWQFTFDGLFSSGLRGGFANRTQLPKVWQFNLSAAKTLDVPVLGHIENRVILLNVFDRINLIRPADRDRSVSGRLRTQSHGLRRADRSVAFTLKLARNRFPPPAPACKGAICTIGLNRQPRARFAAVPTIKIVGPFSRGWPSFWCPALTRRIGHETKPAIYLDGVTGVELGGPLCGPLKHPAPAHAPRPAPVATSSAAAPSGPPPRYHASQTPGILADEDAIVDCDNDQSSVRPCSGTERLVVPG